MQLTRPEAVSVAAPAPMRRALPADAIVDRRELVLLGLLLAAYGAWFAELLPRDYKLINIAGPSALAAILLAGAWWRVSKVKQAIWEPLFWFRIACAAYYGVGAIAPYVANDATVTFMRGLYNFSDEDAFKVGMITLVGVLTVLSTAAVVAARQGYRRPSRAAVSSQRWTLLFAAVLLVGGGAVRYLIVLPWSLGLTDVVPGLVLPLARSYIIGLFLLVLAAQRGSRMAVLFAVVLVPIELAVNLLTFAKTEVLLTLIFVYLAVLQHKFSSPRVLVGLALVLGVYSQLDPVIHYGREELSRRTGSSSQGSIKERLDVLGLYSGSEWQGTERAELQSSLSRLSYVNAAAMVVNRYDAGMPGDSLTHVLVVLVPRFLWPEKPSITAVGTDLYTVATSQEGSSISPGLFAEAYWNFGWLGLPLLMIPLGAILGVFSVYSASMMRQERWFHLPSILIGVFAGIRVDGWYVADIVGGCGTALVYALLARALERSLAHRSAHTRRA